MHKAASLHRSKSPAPAPRALAAAALVLAACASSAAHAAVHITGSVSSSTSNVPFTTYTSRAGSAAVAFDLGQYIRLGYTHRQEISLTESWEKYRPGSTGTSADKTDAEGNLYMKTYDTKHVISNSVDLTIILYQGELFVPYLVAGGVVKTYRFVTRKGSEEEPVANRVTTPPVPNLGAGLDMRLNREFSLRLSYVASPGYAQEPDGEIVGVWDRYTTVGLTYRI